MLTPLKHSESGELSRADSSGSQKACGYVKVSIMSLSLQHWIPVVLLTLGGCILVTITCQYDTVQRRDSQLRYYLHEMGPCADLWEMDLTVIDLKWQSLLWEAQLLCRHSWVIRESQLSIGVGNSKQHFSICLAFNLVFVPALTSLNVEL